LSFNYSGVSWETLLPLNNLWSKEIVYTWGQLKKGKPIPIQKEERSHPIPVCPTVHLPMKPELEECVPPWTPLARPLFHAVQADPSLQLSLVSKVHPSKSSTTALSSMLSEILISTARPPGPALGQGWRGGRPGPRKIRGPMYMCYVIARLAQFHNMHNRKRYRAQRTMVSFMWGWRLISTRGLRHSRSFSSRSTISSVNPKHQPSELELPRWLCRLPYGVCDLSEDQTGGHRDGVIPGKCKASF
jgi:hypothetical protein